MADNKKAFLMYADWQSTIKHLTDEQAGKLLKHLLSYVNDENPVCDNPIINICFEPIKQQLKRDLVKWEHKKSKFSNAGKISGLSRKLSKDQLYIIRMYNDKEEFIKVGVTMNSISRRFSSKGDGLSKSRYSFEVVAQFFPNDFQVSLLDLEKHILNTFKSSKYIPENEFGGCTECFNSDVENDIINTLNDVQRRSTTFNDVKKRSTKRTVNVNVNDNVSVINTNINNNKEINNGSEKTVEVASDEAPIDPYSKFSDKCKELFKEVNALMPEKYRPKTEAQYIKQLKVLTKAMKEYSYEDLKGLILFAVNDIDFWQKNLLSLNSLYSKNKGIDKIDNIYNSYKQNKDKQVDSKNVKAPKLNFIKS